jgi:hypothetical protein
MISLPIVLVLVIISALAGYTFAEMVEDHRQGASYLPGSTIVGLTHAPLTAEERADLVDATVAAEPPEPPEHCTFCTVCGHITPQEPEPTEAFPSPMLAAIVDATRAAAFARAAQAVGLFPHRTDRRGELVQHLLSLADAPEITAPAEEEGAESPEPVRMVATVAEDMTS